MELSSSSDNFNKNISKCKTVKRINLNRTLCQRIFPTGFKQELKSLLEIYFPCVLTGFFRYLNPMISLIMCGHLSKLEFDGASLANSIINIFGVSIDLGFSTAFDTLFAQIYGCDQKKKMGSLLQRAIIIMTLLYLILACFHINIEPFLIWLQQDPSVSELATRYIIFYLPGLYFDFQFLTFSRYLQNQNIVYPMMISAFIGDVFSGVSQYVAIYVYGYNLTASAVLQGVSCFIMFSIQLGYIIISKIYKPTWNGFSLKDAFYNWKIIVVLGLPGILMVALEEWNFQVGTLIAGSLGGAQLGAQSIAFQCGTMSYMISVGLGISVSIRVGQYLGSRDIDRIKTCLRTAVVVGTCASLTSFTLILAFRKYIPLLFTNDLDIQVEAEVLLYFIAFLEFLNVIIVITAGTLKACGRQFLGATIMFCCYYILGIPIGVVLVFVARINIKGMWIGLMTALFIEGIIFIYLISRTNWEVECNKANNNSNYLYNEKNDGTDKTKKSEISPLIVKSDVEGDTHWVRENLYNETPHFRKKKLRRIHSHNENYTVTACRRRSMLAFIPTDYNIEPEESFRKILILRISTISAVLLLFVGSILVRIYVPKSSYFPIINQTKFV